MNQVEFLRLVCTFEPSNEEKGERRREGGGKEHCSYDSHCQQLGMYRCTVGLFSTRIFSLLGGYEVSTLAQRWSLTRGMMTGPWQVGPNPWFTSEYPSVQTACRYMEYPDPFLQVKIYNFDQSKIKNRKSRSSQNANLGLKVYTGLVPMLHIKCAHVLVSFPYCI